MSTYSLYSSLMIYVLLEHIRSLHNVGSVFRTCDGARVEKIYLTGITGRPPHKDIHKVALGAENSVKSEYFADPLKAVAEFKKESKSKGRIPKILISEVTDNAISYDSYQISDNEDLLVIFGNENDGVSKELLSIADEILKIPMHGEKISLNISVSVGIVIYELTKQLNK